VRIAPAMFRGLGDLVARIHLFDEHPVLRPLFG
jgi:hypothetical protein